MNSAVIVSGIGLVAIVVGLLLLHFVRRPPDVSRGNLAALLVGAYASIGLLTFIAVATPYVLTVYLKIPASQQGTVSGDLHLFQEIIALLVFAPIGIIADRVGRRAVFVAGLLCMGLSYSLYSFATSVPELFAYRFIYTIGIAAATGMLGTVIADYSDDASRGVAVAGSGVLNALGVISVAIGLGGLPQFFVSLGASQEAAGHDAYLVVAGICVLVGAILAIGLKKGMPVAKAERAPLAELVRSGFAEGRNPRIALAYASGFIARSDLVLVGTYSTLWGFNAAIAQGMDAADAQAEGRRVFAIISTAALVWLPLMGVLLDRVNRVTGIIVTMALAAVGYLGTSMIGDPLARDAIPLLALLGIGQISAFAGAQTLIAREAPQRTRGSVIGMFNMAGAAGILVATGIGGRLFDAFGPSAPFVFVGALTCLVVAAAVVCRIRAPGPMVSRRPLSGGA